MPLIAALLVALIALEHVGFLVLEVFLWTRPAGQWVFGLTPEAAQAAAQMARTQGIYNGLLAAGLLWTFLIWDPARRRNLRILLLFGVLVAAGFGGVTARPLVFILQGAPALVAFIFVRFADEWSGRA
jgi:putative membrane protein